mmetsp:Transcript_25639/g.48486  ORF Transcript_25639/g.48486 Transcript_25639/m.48486 type:complete len:218 (-) Transcript_25639:2671-3324(-)
MPSRTGEGLPNVLQSQLAKIPPFLHTNLSSSRDCLLVSLRDFCPRIIKGKSCSSSSLTRDATLASNWVSTSAGKLLETGALMLQMTPRQRSPVPLSLTSTCLPTHIRGGSRQPSLHSSEPRYASIAPRWTMSCRPSSSASPPATAKTLLLLLLLPLLPLAVLAEVESVVRQAQAAFAEVAASHPLLRAAHNAEIHDMAKPQLVSRRSWKTSEERSMH